MNSFVIMPFAEAFDDVYVTIKASVVAASDQCECFRLDETRPAGRITDRLLQELRTSSFCIADLTGNRPNIMWEVGYAMALDCPTIILTQNLAELAFDIRDMQCLEYDRTRLNETLGKPLQRVIIDTLSAGRLKPRAHQQEHDLVGQLLSEVADLKTMVAQAVNLSRPQPASTFDDKGLLIGLQGAWVNEEHGGHYYARVIRGDLIVPYCYGGNDKITGAHFGWRKTGSYWFARYAWIGGDAAFKYEPAGYTFVKQEAEGILRGAWWGDDQSLPYPEAPPEMAGVPAKWIRQGAVEVPQWAIRFLGEVEKNGLSIALNRSDQIPSGQQ